MKLKGEDNMNKIVKKITVALIMLCSLFTMVVGKNESVHALDTKKTY